MQYIVSAAIGYLVGTINVAYLIAKRQKVDLKSEGSKNLGASNATMVLGAKAGLVTALTDIFKGVIAILIIRILFRESTLLPVITGVFCVLGHIFPFYLKFKGGKGFATFVGLMFGVSWKGAVIVGLALLLFAFLSNYIVVGTMTAILGFPVYLFIENKNIYQILWMIPLIVLIIFLHRDNLKRIMSGTEFKLRTELLKGIKKSRK